MSSKNIGIICIGIGILVIIIAIILAIPKSPSNVEKINAELNEEKLQVMLKDMFKYLPQAKDINNPEQYDLDNMISYAFSYIGCLNENNVQIDEENALGITKIDLIKENVNYLFDVLNVDLSKSTFEIKDGKIYIPLNLQGGDAQIYKYVETLHYETTGEYIATIDCLEPTSADDVTILLEKTEYNKDAVIATLRIKYKIVNNRKVLLAYTVESNL